MKTACLGNCTGISSIDSSPIRVCNKKRIKNNNVFKGIANVGKSIMGWFYGFKLYIIINDKDEFLDFLIRQAITDDRTPIQQDNFLKNILVVYMLIMDIFLKSLQNYSLAKDYI
jgi:hypothetical protein